MFTGLVEKTGKVENITITSNGAKISYLCDFDNPQTIKKGDSIAVNGVCLTIVEKENNFYTSDIMKETLNHTNLKNLKKGNIINLERAMLSNSRFDGHFVSGHTDNTAMVKSIKSDGFSKRIEFICDSELIIQKGSICVNGVSLTVSNVLDYGFEVSLIPATLNNTNLKELKVQDIVNIEYDLIGKYVKKFLDFKKSSKITEEFLKENGF